MGKKDVGILAFQNTLNYGADLQIYALARTIKKLEREPIVIDYRNKFIERSEFPTFKNSSGIKGLLKVIFFKFFVRRKYLEFKRFKENYFQLSKKVYTESSFKGAEDDFSKIIVGSDQIWNTNITGADLNYFLLDLSEKKVSKYSYAASFGVSEYEKLHLQDKIKKALESFKIISTREKSGERLVIERFNQPAQTVLDPTLLLTSIEWREFAKDSNLKKNKHYLLLYFIKNSKMLDLAKKYAENNDLEIKYINIKPFMFRGMKTIPDASPIDYIKLISEANAVITGSFHGFVLSLNLNVPVAIDLDKGSLNKNTRLENIMKIFDIKGIGTDEKFESISFYNDFSKFNLLLKREREKSLEKLWEMLN
ncbi:MAG: polysaccharide pyruvyl transferase family protein [Turicibacter sp.]|nr:polysaccharide pyruvyl transferase family protein [Turicibacter sp.]